MEELAAALSPWVTLAIVLGVFLWLRQDIRDIRQDMRDLREDMRDMREDMRDMRSRMDRLEAGLGEVKEGLAEMRGQLTLICDYILRRNAPPETQTGAPAE